MNTLTCAACSHALYPHTARATEDGWAHVACPDPNVCGTCHATLVGRWQWNKQPADVRRARIAEGFRRKARHGVCSRCAHNKVTSEAGERRRAEGARIRAERLEDLRWMDACGENANGAAMRLGMTADALWKFLHRVDEPDLLARLVARNPRDHNTPSAIARESLREQRAAA